nr:hypothetical protein BGP147 [Borreliella bavariensis PBi]
MIENEEKEDLQAQVNEDQRVKSDTRVISVGEFEKYMRFKEQAK